MTPTTFIPSGGNVYTCITMHASHRSMIIRLEHCPGHHGAHLLATIAKQIVVVLFLTRVTFFLVMYINMIAIVYVF